VSRNDDECEATDWFEENTFGRNGATGIDGNVSLDDDAILRRGIQVCRNKTLHGYGPG
jgi:hypothetical protein